MWSVLSSLFNGFYTVLNAHSVLGLNLWSLFCGFFIVGIAVTAIQLLFKLKGG